MDLEITLYWEDFYLFALEEDISGAGGNKMFVGLLFQVLDKSKAEILGANEVLHKILAFYNMQSVTTTGWQFLGF